MNESRDEFRPEYSPWRHGGWYVDNLRYPSGACGCVSRNYPDRKWRIACDTREGDHTYPNRDAAARAEHELVKARYAANAAVLSGLLDDVRPSEVLSALAAVCKKHRHKYADAVDPIEALAKSLRGKAL